MYLSTMTFHLSTPPNFDRLKQRGWVHPLGIRDEPLTSSLIKTFERYAYGQRGEEAWRVWQIQIVRHRSPHWDYAEAYIHDIPERTVMKKGEGEGMDCLTAVWLVRKLYEELEE